MPPAPLCPLVSWSGALPCCTSESPVIHDAGEPGKPKKKGGKGSAKTAPAGKENAPGGATAPADRPQRAALGGNWTQSLSTRRSARQR